MYDSVIYLNEGETVFVSSGSFDINGNIVTNPCLYVGNKPENKYAINIANFSKIPSSLSASTIESNDKQVSFNEFDEKDNYCFLIWLQNKIQNCDLGKQFFEYYSGLSHRALNDHENHIDIINKVVDLWGSWYFPEEQMNAARFVEQVYHDLESLPSANITNELKMTLFKKLQKFVESLQFFCYKPSYQQKYLRLLDGESIEHFCFEQGKYDPSSILKSLNPSYDDTLCSTFKKLAENTAWEERGGKTWTNKYVAKMIGAIKLIGGCKIFCVNPE